MTPTNNNSSSLKNKTMYSALHRFHSAVVFTRSISDYIRVKLRSFHQRLIKEGRDKMRTRFFLMTTETSAYFQTLSLCSSQNSKKPTNSQEKKSKEQNQRKRVKEVGMLGHAMADHRVVLRPSGQDGGYRGDFSHRMLRFHLQTSPPHTAYGVWTPGHPSIIFIPDHVTSNLHSVLFVTHSRLVSSTSC